VLDTHGDNYGRARTSVPPPDRFDNVERRLQMAIAANQAPASLGRYTPLTVACTRSWPNSMVKPCRAMRTTRPPLRTPALPTIRCNRRCGPVSNAQGGRPHLSGTRCRQWDVGSESGARRPFELNQRELRQ